MTRAQTRGHHNTATNHVKKRHMVAPKQLQVGTEGICIVIIIPYTPEPIAYNLSEDILN